MAQFGQAMGPGMQATVETEENEFRLYGDRSETRTLRANVTVASDAVDAGNTPTTTLRGGLVMAKKTSGGKFYPYDPTATDGTQNPVGILPTYLSTLDGTGTAADKYVPLIVGGAVDAAKLYGLDANAQRILRQRGFIFNVWSSSVTPGSEGLPGHAAIQAKSADYTVVAADNGTLFVATAAVNFTLPTIAPGLAFEFWQTANSNLVVTGSTNIVTTNNAGASSITFSTASQKIGSLLSVRAVRVGAAYLWQARNIGGTTMTIA